MKTLDDLQNAAIAYETAKARREQTQEMAEAMRYAGVAVYAIMPQNRSTYRKPHWRFQYYVDGKKATASVAYRRITP